MLKNILGGNIMNWVYFVIMEITILLAEVFIAIMACKFTIPLVFKKTKKMSRVENILHIIELFVLIFVFIFLIGIFCILLIV
jgi:hypothetical protein